ncbi:MAG: MarR family transcriptional regulator [Chloroflexota bacterium]|nr:MAG: MarR family transcriptional regulator [Chloroflexota bacterium]
MDPEFDRDIATFWRLLFVIVLDGEKRLAANIASHELTPPQFYVLKTLSERGGRCAIGQIARQHHLTNATMTGLIKRMEAADPPLVARERSGSDRRSVVVTLTPAGHARFLAVQADLMEQLRAALALTSLEERKQLLHFLDHYVRLVPHLFPAQPASDSGPAE